MNSGVVRSCLTGLLLTSLVAGATGRAAAGAPDRAHPAVPARPTLDALARAWEAEDHGALAARVAPDGVDIAFGQGGARNHYSASQAFYFFKNLFQSTETVSFRVSLLNDEAQTGLVHAVADWTRRRSGESGAVPERLVITLARGEAGWGLTGIRAIR
ncbi:MAG: nuclear transport factor 2-like protein [Candidatus Krumholzibacteriia bacterium]